MTGLDDLTQDDLNDFVQRLRVIAKHTSNLHEGVHQLARLLHRHALDAALPDEQEMPFEQKRRRASVRKTMSTPEQAIEFLRGAAAARFCGPSHLHLWAAQQRLAGRLE